ncbi:MAG: elongation factor G [Bacteroidia bacterium]|nr:elongation factor G [Bacteroidia bacterium]
MKTYDEKHIKNIVLAGAPKSGKTTLCETMLFEAGIIQRRGTVEEKNTVSDYHEIEQQRGSSVYATSMHTEWKDYKINIIDTPGLNDFIGEVIASMRVCDTVVMLLNAQHGVEVGTQLLWHYIDAYRKPTIFCINQCDHEKSDFFNAYEQARQTFGNAVTLMQYPLQQGADFHEIVDLLKMTVYRFEKNGGKPQKLPIPDSEKERAEKLHNALVEKAAENDEKLMELYFEKGNLDEDELRKGIKEGMMHHDVFPVFCLSAKNDMGSGRLMGFIDNVAPCAIEMPAEKTTEDMEVLCEINKPASLFIFKTVIEPHLGKLSYFKVMRGEVNAGMDLQNEITGTTERLNQLFITDGKNRNPIGTLKAGDIGCTLKLKNTNTNHTLNVKGNNFTFQDISFPTPRIRTGIVAKNKADDEKLSMALHEIHAGDLTLIVEHSQELKQTLLHAQGDLHLQTIKWTLEHVYKIESQFVPARISYRETIRTASLANYRHKKQSGGAGQFGEVHIKIEPYFEGMPQVTEYSVRDTEEHPLPWGGKLVFNNCIVGGVIDARFIPAIQKGILEKMQEGPLTGSHVCDVRVSVYDGKMHPVDSNDISFKIAGMMAFKDAFHLAQPQLLEPVQEIAVTIPEEILGDVMTELQGRRSIILGIDNHNGMQIVKAHTPLAEMDKLQQDLRSISQGRGFVSSKFHDYLPVPADLQIKLTDAYKKQQTDEH